MNTPPERVFAVLSDRDKYQGWVVGTEHTTESEGDWPEPGSTLSYTVAGPLPDADITIDLIPENGGTRVRMHERPANGIVNVITGPIGHYALSKRNQEALDRLRQLAETGTSDG